MKNKVKISVRDLVEFILQSGDLFSGFSGTSRNVEAIKAHQKIQNSSQEEYSPEVTVKQEVIFEDMVIEVNGRIDGVIQREEIVVIDEIKTTTLPLSQIEEEYNMLHWAQAKCYAYIYGHQNGLESLGVQLTYYNLDTEEMKFFNKSCLLRELEDFFYGLIKKYVYWAKIINSFKVTRNDSIKAAKFPHNEFRKGQRDMSVRVYRIAKDGGKLFAQAPTGTGKTIATIFPALKALGEEHISKVFYLTAKSTTGVLAENAVSIMREKGLRLKTINLCAKEKICFMEEVNCNPESCKYAKGHFDRIKGAVEDIYNEDAFTRRKIEEYAKKHVVCPFEFSLDLTLWTDCIICDYNYVFDPRVYLKRFFMDTSGDYLFLIDEAHNLVDRSREMFSAELFKQDFLDLKKLVKEGAPEIYKTVDKINKFLIEERKSLEEDNFLISKEPPKDFYPLLRKFTTVSEKWLVRNLELPFRKSLLDLYFQVIGFIRTSEYYDEKYVTYIEKADNDVRIKLFCLDPSFLLGECMKRGKAAALFSATLTPMDYFTKILGGDEDSLRIKLMSPFPRENLCIMVENKISTKFTNREKSYLRIANLIHLTISQKKGNYLVFFSSYKYLNEVLASFQFLNTGVRTIVQSSGMKDEEREDFLGNFSLDIHDTLVGFAVMGGIFGEGIDLKGDKLSGAIIVGVGLPQICLERDIIKEYFQENRGQGFEYSYIYPGMNKVMQAVGRVIRTKEDKGIVVLIDERFSFQTYQNLFPQEWNPVLKMKNTDESVKVMKEFWK
ncbi:MAG: PD-(D/E)XK nuclease family protein [Clostridiaceae bacterium]|nr:PD-(D/E)XK nuclease family protein [Clostridiaceae bacterium]